MGMMIFINLTVGLGLLLVGGRYLVQHAVQLAGKIGVSPLVIGMTIVAFGTSSPELVVSIGAILTAHDDIVIGNIVGGNIVNILLVLSLSVLIFPIPVSRRFIAREGTVTVGAILVFMALCFDGVVSFTDGLVLLAGFAGFIATTLMTGRDEDQSQIDGRQHAAGTAPLRAQDLGLHGLWIAGALTALAVGSNLFVTGAADLSRLLGVSEAVIGLTVVAVGTAAPEIVIATIAAWRRESGVAIGSVLGSNMFNMLGIGGITALVSPISVNPHFIEVDVMVLLAATICVVLIGYMLRSLGRVVGALLLAAYITYTVSLF